MVSAHVSRALVGVPPTLVPRFINTTTFVASIFGSGEARRGSIPRSGAVTEEQRSQNRKATQPSGRRFFLAPTSLLTPYRPLKGMRVARASSGPKIPRRKRGRIYEMGYLEPVLKMGGAGDPPSPVGDRPTGTGAGNVAKRPCPLAGTVAPVRSGEPPDGTGGSLVLPANHSPNAL